MRILFAALLTACALDAQAQFNQNYTTCGTNHVTELDAGGVTLPNDDIVIPIDTTGPEFRVLGIGLSALANDVDLFAAVCQGPPGPTADCFLMLDSARPPLDSEFRFLQPGQYHLVVEAVSSTNAAGTGLNAACGEFRLFTNGPL